VNNSLPTLSTASRSDPSSTSRVHVQHRVDFGVAHQLRNDFPSMVLAAQLEVAHPSSAYRPRSPADSVLYHIVRDHLETFRGLTARVCDGERLRRFSEEEFEGVLRCGWLASMSAVSM
jgi:hypothetical protein